MQSIRDCYNGLEARHRRLGLKCPLPSNTFLKKVMRGTTSVTDAARLTSKNFTNSTWEIAVKLNYYNVASYGLFGKLNHFYVIFSAGDYLPRANIGGTNRAHTLTDKALLGKWVRLSFVVNGANFISYLDGEEIQNTTYTGALSSNANTYAIGSLDSINGAPNAEIADFRIWSVARTQQQIRDTLQIGAIKGAATGLETCIEFDNIDAGTAADYSGNGWNATSVDDLLQRIGVVKL